MFGGGSIQLARVFGIRIGVDVSWFIVLFLIIWSLSGYYADLFPGDDGKAFALAVASALLFFLSIVLHELGHALVAIRNGIGISGIDLWMFGGLAKMKRDTDSAGVEFRVAVAGPIVTLVIAAACFGAGALIGGADDVWRSARFDDVGVSEAEAVLGYLAFINFALLVFNLIPGFPLDGGRIARAIAWWRTGDRTRATRFAARLGRLFAYAMVGLAIFLFLTGSLVGGLWLGFIGFFLAQAARTAELQSEYTSRIEGLRVADLMDAEPVAVRAQTPVDRVLDEYFLRYGWPWFPVVDDSGHMLGIVSREQVEDVPAERRATQAVDEVTTLDPTSAFRVRVDEPLEAVLGSEGFQRLGALVAVDADGVVRGVVTLDRVRRALQPGTPAA
jgi:Zn-dependent protease